MPGHSAKPQWLKIILYIAACRSWNQENKAREKVSIRKFEERTKNKKGNNKKKKNGQKRKKKTLLNKINMRENKWKIKDERKNEKKISREKNNKRNMELKWGIFWKTILTKL